MTQYLKERYQTVYHDEDQIPEAVKHYVPTTQSDIEKLEEWRKQEGISERIIERQRRVVQAGRRLVALHDGVKLRWDLRHRGLFWMECVPISWVSGTGGELREDIHIWLLGRWVKVWNLGGAVS